MQAAGAFQAGTGLKKCSQIFVKCEILGELKNCGIQRRHLKNNLNVMQMVKWVCVQFTLQFSNRV